MKKIKVGIFDSGSGGLSVVKQLKSDLNKAKYTKLVSINYLGDTKNFPYGTKSQCQLKKIVKNNITYFLNSGCDIVGIACNTASTVLMSDYRRYSSPRIMSILETSIESLSQMHTNNIHVVASYFTVNSGIYPKLIQLKQPNIKVTVSTEQRLITAIEHRQISLIQSEIKRIIQFLPANTDHLVLGCTHFSLIKNLFVKEIKKQERSLAIIDPTLGMAKKLFNFIDNFIKNDS
jgi:glutamate racemase